MTRAVLTRRTQTEGELYALYDAKEFVVQINMIANDVETCHLNLGPTSSESCLQSWLKKPISVIEQTRAGFYVCVAVPTNRALVPEEEQNLLDKVISVFRSKN